MTSATATLRSGTSPAARGFRAEPAPGRSGLRPRRQLPWMVAGVVLVAGCALAFALITVRAGGARQVLVTARPVAVGHRLSSADVRAVPASGAAAANWLAAGQEGSVLGRPAALPLAAGTPLTDAELGSPSGLTAGDAVVAVALKPGQFPPVLAAGDTVLVVATTPAPGAVSAPAATTATTGGGTAPAASMAATVTAVNAAAADSGGVNVVSLQVGNAEAAGLARLSAAGQVALVLRPAGGTG